MGSKTTKKNNLNSNVKSKLKKRNSYFGTSNINVGKGFALAFLESGLANVSIRMLTGNTNLALSKYYDIGVNVVSGLIGGTVGAGYIKNIK